MYWCSSVSGLIVFGGGGGVGFVVVSIAIVLHQVGSTRMLYCIGGGILM